MRLTIFFVILFISFGMSSSIAAAKQNHTVTIIVKSSPTSLYESKMTIKSKEIISKLKDSKGVHTTEHMPLTDTFVVIKSNGVNQKFYVNSNWQLYNIKQQKKWNIPSKLVSQLKDIQQKLKAQHYGTIIPWEQVNEIIPKYSTFKIIDIETGLSFNGQRRAGSKHADVQPITKEDTKIMKQIFNGKWSWNRRAIIIMADHQKIAASMHGMPHGSGALINGFPGHFCIHFKSSTTHSSRSEDFSHQLMVRKAAGITGEYFLSISPMELIDSFLFSVNQRDLHIFSASIIGDKRMVAEDYFNKFNSLEGIARTSPIPSENSTGSLVVDIPLKIEYYGEDLGAVQKIIHFYVTRNSFIDPWKLEIEEIRKQIFFD
ncbi:hypothetical protein [Bacillus sp. SM2101]|uniref:hypothetical protein n=1 Tax=Bacillus sp. SM2101 TaxID=2805366 RepID=UPI001BDEF342|nr:hypothetical protein [Bacillus sp. SM2101]